MTTYTFVPATDKQYSFANSILTNRYTGGYQSEDIKALVESHKCSKWEMSKLIDSMLTWQNMLRNHRLYSGGDVEAFSEEQESLIKYIRKSIAEREVA